jgi:hypothetical protein
MRPADPDHDRSQVQRRAGKGCRNGASTRTFILLGVRTLIGGEDGSQRDDFVEFNVR